MALSPDGKLIAFVVGGDVFVTAVRSKDDQEIAAPPTVRVTATPEREQNPVFSPDGETLVFASARGGNLDLYAARRIDDGKDWTENFEFPVTALTATPQNERAPRFSPDGKQILFQRGRGDLAVMDAGGANARVLFTHFSAPEVAWSPDGKFIAYAQEDESANSEVFILPLAGGEPYNVSRHPDNDLAPAWSPDGRRLIWLSRRHANTLDVWSVWLTRADDERTPEDWLKVWNDKPEPKKDEAAKGEKKDEKKAEKGAGKDAKAAKAEDKADAGKKLPVVTIDFERLWERVRPVTELKGAQGSYGAKIVPLRGGRRLDIFPKEALALEFMNKRDTYTEEERKKIQEELMQHISKEAVTCRECHRRQGYLPLASIGYSQSRMDQLAQLEVIKLIDEYTKFYLPAMFDPDASGRNKETQTEDQP
jgi:dipeptidyl aminopeptidase/acylaminoacyl peptidase